MACSQALEEVNMLGVSGGGVCLAAKDFELSYHVLDMQKNMVLGLW